MWAKVCVKDEWTIAVLEERDCADLNQTLTLGIYELLNNCQDGEEAVI
jgi:hypothetical protein